MGRGVSSMVVLIWAEEGTMEGGKNGGVSKKVMHGFLNLF